MIVYILEYKGNYIYIPLKIHTSGNHSSQTQICLIKTSCNGTSGRIFADGSFAFINWHNCWDTAEKDKRIQISVSVAFYFTWFQHQQHKTNLHKWHCEQGSSPAISECTLRKRQSHFRLQFTFCIQVSFVQWCLIILNEVDEGDPGVQKPTHYTGYKRCAYSAVVNEVQFAWRSMQFAKK